MAQPNLVLVDAHSLLFQVYHAIRQPMTSPDGRPTNAVYGFTRDIFFLREQLKPDYLVFAFDLPTPTFRSAIAEDYKAHRPPPPEDLIIQVPMIQKVIEAFNLPVLTAEGYEADDVIATVATAGCKLGMNVVIATTDKDCRQLLNDCVRMFNLRKGAFLDCTALMDDWGIRPDQVIDYQAMVGDSVDNVKGVPGVGAKTATKLLQEFGSLDELLRRVAEVKPDRIQKALRESTEAVQTSRKLVTLATDVPISLDWDRWKLRDWDSRQLLALFEEFGFRGFAQRVRGEKPAPSPPKDLFPDDDAAPLVEPPLPVTDWESDYKLVDTPDAFAVFLADLKKQPLICFDLETTGLDPHSDAIVGLAVCWQARTAYYLPVRGPAGSPLLDEAATLAALKPILEDPAVGKRNQNIKFDLLVLRQHGIRVRGVAGDPMLADYLLRAGERSHNLDDLARKQLGHENVHIEELIGKKGKNQTTMDKVPTDKVCAYAAEDVDVAWRLAEKLEAELTATDSKLKDVYDTIEIPLIDVLADMERTGIRLDTGFLQKLSVEMERDLARTEAEIHEIAGESFKISSPVQLRKILFDKLGLPSQKKTTIGGVMSTDQETLERLAPLHPLPRKIVEYRQIAKLRGTYVDALPGLVNQKTGRLHTSFNQTVAATGRLSSTDPNLQNIPARTEMGRQIRQAFLPKAGWKLLTADYSQIELRLLAHCSGDAVLKQTFVDGKDIHAQVANRLFGIAEKDVKSEQRRVAKTVNFGVIYGISAHGLSIRLGIPRDEAQKFIDNYFAQFPTVQAYQAELLAKCHQNGYVATLLGRRRTISGVRARTSYRGLNQPEREAVNMEIQGSAADMMKLAMLAVYKRIAAEQLKSRMLLTVHDELVLEAPPDEVDRLAKLVREEMCGALPLSVPVEVDVAVGPNWLDVEEF